MQESEKAIDKLSERRYTIHSKKGSPGMSEASPRSGNTNSNRYDIDEAEEEKIVQEEFVGPLSRARAEGGLDWAKE